MHSFSNDNRPRTVGPLVSQNMTNDNEGKRRVDDMEGMREGDEEGGTTTPGSSRLVYRVDDSPPAHIALISAIQVIETPGNRDSR